MIEISDDADRLDILSPMPWGTRILLAFFALVPLLAPYELLVRIPGTDYWHPFFLLAGFISMGATALSMFLVFAAAAGLSSQMTLDAARSTFSYSTTAPVIPRRTEVRPLASLASVAIRTHDWSDGSPSYSLTIKMSDGATFDSGSSWSRDDVERVKARVDAFLRRHRS